MNVKLEKYFEIELATISKQKRNELHAEFLLNLVIESITFEDISASLNEAEYKNVVITQPFFEKIIYPILQEEINRNNLRAIKHLIKLEQKLLKLQLQTKNYKPTKRQLIISGLEIKPDDKELLELYEEDLCNYLKYAIHEIPHGVLYGIDGANESECRKLLELLHQYKKVCEKLSLDRSVLIGQCSFHFQNYEVYLPRRNEFKGYEDFLNKEHLNFPNFQKRL